MNGIMKTISFFLQCLSTNNREMTSKHTNLCSVERLAAPIFRSPARCQVVMNATGRCSSNSGWLVGCLTGFWMSLFCTG